MKVLKSIQGQLGLLFLVIFLLLTISVGATYFGVQAQRTDAVLINLAGRQRMLLQRMVNLALTDPDGPQLSESIQLFEGNLSALLLGGMVDTGQLDGANILQNRTLLLPAAKDVILINELEKVVTLWKKFSSHLQSPDSNVPAIEAVELLTQLDAVVGRYETLAQQKLLRVQIIQAASLIIGVTILIVGYLLTKKRIITPLSDLRKAAQRITIGQMGEPISQSGSSEIEQLSQSFDQMRREVATVQDRLESLVAQRTRELETAFELSQEIVTEFNLDTLLQSVIDRARNLTGATSAALCLLETQPDSLKLVRTSGRPSNHLGLLQPLENDPSIKVVKAGETLVTETSCTHCRFLTDHTPGHCVIAPLHSGNTTLGALCVVRNSRTFDADETRALTLLANSATIAIANARLVEEGRRKAEQTAALAEREKLAAELHDNLAQTLGFLNLKSERIQNLITSGRVHESSGELEVMNTAINSAYVQVRRALEGLMEYSEPGNNFPGDISTCVDQMRKTTGVIIHLEMKTPEKSLLTSLAQSQSQQIIREAITNAFRHAHAEQVWVQLAADDSQTCISIEDDGQGFDPDIIQVGDHRGLQIMRMRAERSGGLLTIESSPNKGTTVELVYQNDKGVAN